MATYDDLLFGPRQPRQLTEPVQPIPQLAPEEQQSILDRVGSTALHGLGWVGGSLGKALGGRAIRSALGLLTGTEGANARDLMSIIPFSDTLGITNPDDEVTGSMLLGGNADTPFLSPEGIGGLGIDILTDPATYLSFGAGAVNKLGAAAKRAGVLPGTTAGRLAGVAAASPEAAAIARQAGTTAAEVAGQRLGGHIGVGLPFMGNQATFDLTRPIGAVMSVPGVTPVVNAVDTVTEPFRRGFKQLFQGKVRDTLDASLQPAAEWSTEQLARRLPEELDTVANFAQWMQRKVGWTPEKEFSAPMKEAAKDLGRQLTQAIELTPSAEQALHPNYAQLVAGIDPEIIAKAREFRPIYDRMLAQTRAAGYGDVALDDIVGYAAREAGILPSNAFDATSATGAGGLAAPKQKMRELTRGLLESQANEIAMNDALRAQKPADAAQYIAERYFGFDPAKQAEYAALTRKAGRTLSGPEEERLAELIGRRNARTITLPEATELSGLELRKASNITSAEAARLKELEKITSQAADLASWNRGLEKNKADLEKLGGYFVGDPVAALGKYITNNTARITNAEGIYRALADMSSKALPQGTKGTVLTDALARIGLTGEAAIPNLAEAIANARGISPQEAMGIVSQGMISPEQLKALTDFIKPATAPAGARPFLSVYDSILNLTKAGQTSWPQTIARNMISDVAQRWFQGGDALTPLALGKQLREGKTIKGIGEQLARVNPIFAGMTDEQATQQILKEAWKHGVANTQKFQALEATGIDPSIRVLQRELPVIGAPERGILSTLADTIPGRSDLNLASPNSRLNPLNVRGVAPLEAGAVPRLESKFAPVAAAQSLGAYNEEINRLGTFANALQQGLDPLAAMQRVEAAHFDYGNLSRFERDFMRRIMPFYSFSRQALPGVIGELATNPGGRMAQTLRAVNAAAGPRPGFIPEGVSNTGMAIPVSGEENGRRSYLTGLGLPFEELANLTSLGNLAGSTSPFLRAPIEYAMGRQFYTGRDIPATYPVEGGPLMNLLISNSPVGRLFSTYNQVTNPNRGWGETAIQTLLGPRITNIDVNQSRRQAVMEAANDMLRGLPQTRVFDRLSINPQNFQTLSPEEQRMYMLYQLANRPQSR